MGFAGLTVNTYQEELMLHAHSSNRFDLPEALTRKEQEFCQNQNVKITFNGMQTIIPESLSSVQHKN